MAGNKPGNYKFSQGTSNPKMEFEYISEQITTNNPRNNIDDTNTTQRTNSKTIEIRVFNLNKQNPTVTVSNTKVS